MVQKQILGACTMKHYESAMYGKMDTLRSKLVRLSKPLQVTDDKKDSLANYAGHQ